MIIFLEVEGGVLQLAKFGPGRGREGSVISKKGAFCVQSESQCPHTAFIVYAEEEIALQKLSGTAARLSRTYSFTPAHEEVPPAIRTGIGKHAEETVAGVLSAVHTRKEAWIQNGKWNLLFQAFV